MEKNSYIISSIDMDGATVIKDGNEFLNWYMKEKPAGKKIKFVKVKEEIENIYKFLNFHLKTKKEIETKMDEYNKMFSKEKNPILKEALDQFISSNCGGKFLRGSLIALGYNSLGKNDKKFLPLSIALELFQTSILIHDDIIDMADIRRGMDTIPKKYEKLYSLSSENVNFYKDRKQISDSMALCLGDLGFYLANQIIVENYSNNPKLADILSYYNQIAIKTCKGEMIDVMLPFKEKYYKTENLEENILEIYKLKTAWYSVTGPYVLGCILAGLDSNKIKEIEKALLNLGIAFQIKDDLLGMYGNEEKLGKSVLSDATEFKQTLLYSYVIKTKYKNQFLKLYGKKDLTKEELEEIKQILEQSGSKNYSVKMMEKLFNESIALIKSLEFLDENPKQILLGFAEYLRVRRK